MRQERASMRERTVGEYIVKDARRLDILPQDPI